MASYDYDDDCSRLSSSGSEENCRGGNSGDTGDTNSDQESIADSVMSVSKKEKKQERKMQKEQKQQEKKDKQRAKELVKEEKKLRERELKLEKKLQREEERRNKELEKEKEVDKKKFEKEEKTRSKKEPNMRMLRIFEGRNEWRIKVYVGTPTEDINKCIRLEARIPDSVEELRFLDEDGTPMVLSSHLPNNTCLYMQRVEGLPSSAIESEWTWDINSRTCRHHVLSDDGLTLVSTQKKGYGGIRATTAFTSGVHWWSILFDPLQECVCGGVAAPEDIVGVDNPYMSPFGFSGAVLGDPYSDGGNESPTECGFFLDMDERTLRVYNLTKAAEDGESKCRIKYTNLPSEVYPCVGIKHITRAVVTSTDLAAMPTHLNADYDDDRLPENLVGFLEGSKEIWGM